MTRFVKQLIFGAIYLLIIGSFLWWVYRIISPAPTCTDGVQNGREEGLDCGATACGKSCPVALKDLQVASTEVISYGNGNFDALVHLENPNTIYGAARVDYTLKISDAGGGQLASRRGTTYVNPLEPRYIVLPLTGISGTPTRAELTFAPTDVSWAALDIQGSLGVEFAVRQDQLTPASASLRYAANVVNNSKFDFEHIDVSVLLFDASGKVVGAGSTVVNTLAAGGERGFVIDWPFAVPSAVRAQAMVTTNVFDNANYIRTFGSQEQFQGF